MSRIHLYLPGNTRHSNLRPRARRAYIANFGTWLDVLKRASFPFSVSFQHDDLDVFGLDESAFKGIELLSAPGNHFLPSRFEKHPVMGIHARWQLQDRRVNGNVPGYFTAEFDIPRTDILPPGFQILFAVPKDTVAYSEVGIGDIDRATPLDQYKAIRFHDKIIVPMLGAKPMQDAFFFWQRFRSAENLDKLLAEIRKVTQDGNDDVLVFFLDLEAPIVGSHHGLEIWGDLFASIRDSGLAKHFIGFNEAAEVWKRQAVKPEGPTWTLFARNLGMKWTGLQPQLDYVDQIMLLRGPRSEAEHRLLSQATTSDVLSAWHRKLVGGIEITSDYRPIQIGYDQGVIDVALLAFKAYRERRSFAELAKHIQDDDVRWFAERIAATLPV